MSGSARVQSIDNLKDFREKLAAFGTTAGEALVSIDLEIRHVYDWLADQAKHWQREIRKRQEDVVRAKNELVQRQYMDRDGRGPGTTDQEVALKKAQHRLAEAEDKLENCRRWSRQLPHNVVDYEGPSRQLRGLLEADLKNSLAILERKIAALEAYAALTAPSGGGPTS